MSRNSAARAARARSRRCAARSGSHRRRTRSSRAVRWRIRRGVRGRRAACRRTPRCSLVTRPEQVVHAGVIARQQRHMGERATTGYVVVTAGRPAHSGSLEPGGAGREVRLHTDDRFDAGRARLRVELVGAEQIAVIGHRERGHSPSGTPRPAAPAAGPRRRAWSTPCARADARTSQFLHVPRRLGVPLGTAAALLRP